MKLITLLTDFTEKDGYPGVMKGVILCIAPDARIVDLSHDIAPQDVLGAALLLGRSAPCFPDGAVHVCVVDPGVGTRRRGIIARLDRQFYVGPDNGLMTLLYRQALKENLAAEIHLLENPDFQLHPVSHTFHGRDIFAPAAAHLVNGAALKSFGGRLEDPVLLSLPEAERTDGGWKGQVIHIDAFGNLACNLCAEHIANPEFARIHIKGQVIQGIKTTFGEGKTGEMVAVMDSFGWLSVCVVNGSAAERLGVRTGEHVYVEEV